MRTINPDLLQSEKMMKCCYPNCFNCPFEDCKYENPARALRYYAKNGRERQKRYRDVKIALSGEKTEKQRMIEKQDKIYEFVVKYIKENLYPPSTREIQEALGISGTAEASRDLKRLEARGLIELGNGARKIKLSGYEIVEKRGKINE